jgi:excisionase family DNA binding protein
MSYTAIGPPSTEFLTVADAAEQLHVTERFIRKLIATGDLRAVKVGSRLVRIRRSDLEGLLRPVRVTLVLGRR